MSYCYKIQPKSCYSIIRNCSKCGSSMHYRNTNRFRINANGNFLDIWLIYQCEFCKNTYNLPIFERVLASSINQVDYQKFMENNLELALQYGLNKGLFAKNKVSIDWNNMEYDIVLVDPVDDMDDLKIYQQLGDEYVVLWNPSEIKIQIDRILAELFQVSRSNIKKMMKNGEISCLDKKNSGNLCVIRHPFLKE